MNELIFKLWAKTDPYHPLYCHMIDTGYVTGALLKTAAYKELIKKFSISSGLLQDQIINWLMYLSALHDIGKCHADFQGKGPSNLIEPLLHMGLSCHRLQEKFRHEAFSAQWLLGFFKESFNWNKAEARTIATCMRGHHGNFKAEFPDDEIPILQIQWNPLRIELEKIIRDIFKPVEWIPNFIDHSTIGILLSGLIVLSDWIASNSQLFFMEHGCRKPDDYSKISQERAKKAITSLQFDDELLWPNNIRTFREIWPGITVPRPIQLHCEQLCIQKKVKPGLAIIEAPMGEGKTEAAVYLAVNWMAQIGSSGMYIALPTAATSNQMYNRLNEFLSIHSRETARKLKLVHGTAWLLDENVPESLPELSGDSRREAEQALEWFRPKKRCLLAAYGVARTT